MSFYYAKPHCDTKKPVAVIPPSPRTASTGLKLKTPGFPGMLSSLFKKWSRTIKVRVLLALEKFVAQRFCRPG